MCGYSREETVTVLAERLLSEQEHYNSLVRQEVFRFLDTEVVRQHFGDPFFDMTLHCDLAVKHRGVVKLASIRTRKQSDRHYDQVTKNRWNADHSDGELLAGHDKLYFYCWQQHGEVTECYLVDMEKLRAMILLDLLGPPDSNRIPGGHNGRQVGWGWDIGRLDALCLILGHWKQGG